jgi:hypothetical protein
MKVKTFFGWLLLVVGAFVAVLSGGCTVYFMVQNIMNSTDRGDIVIPLAVGGIPCIISTLVYHFGKWLLRKESKDGP